MVLLDSMLLIRELLHWAIRAHSSHVHEIREIFRMFMRRNLPNISDSYEKRR